MNKNALKEQIEFFYRFGGWYALRGHQQGVRPRDTLIHLQEIATIANLPIRHRVVMCKSAIEMIQLVT